MITWFCPPTTVGWGPTGVQFTVFRSAFCCREKPAEGAGHEMRTVFVLVSEMASKGAPGVCTAMRLQNPPVRENPPPVIAAPASGCPMVPLNVYSPLLLVPPPPAILN